MDFKWNFWEDRPEYTGFKFDPGIDFAYHIRKGFCIVQGDPDHCTMGVADS